MSREDKLVKNTIILAIGTLFPKIAIFITLPILTARLTKTEYGTYDLVLVLVTLLLPAATLQIHSAAFRFLKDVPNDEEEKSSIITNIYALILPVSVVALAILCFFLNNLSWAVRIAICAYFFCDIIAKTNQQIIRGLSQNIAYSISAFLSSLGQLVFTILLVSVFDTRLLGGVIAICVSEFISAFYLLFKGKIYRYIHWNKISKAKLKEMLSYSWPIVPNSLSQWVMHVSDRLVIIAMMGVASNAVYAVAYKLPSILSFAQYTFNMSWQENATECATDEDVEKYYSTMFDTLFKLIAGGLAFLIGITPVLFKLFVKGDYAEAYYQIPILFLAIMFHCLSAFWGGIFVAYKKTKAVATTTIIAAVTNLVIDISTMHWIGLYAASLSTLVSYVVLCVLRLLSVRKFLNIHYRYKFIAGIMLLLIVECVLCFMQLLPLNIFNFVFGTVMLFVLNRKMLKSMYTKFAAKMGKLKT